MAYFQAKAFQSVEASAFARAKKLADLAIKTNTNDSGNPTAAGYQQAVSILSPYINSSKEKDAIDAQRLIAGYSNSLDKLTTKERNQNETVSAFKLQEQDAYFTSADGDYGSFRNPGDIVDATSESLDGLVLAVSNAIDVRNANDESTDALEGYLRELTDRANAMRDLSTKYNTGQLGQGQTLDGFGYFVDTNPLDGTIRRAAVLPVGMLPSGIGEGYKRLEATSQLGSGLLPVYAPATQDERGEYVSRIGDAVWSGISSDGALRKNKASKGSTYLFQDGGFNLNDSTKFQLNKTKVGNGSFVSGAIGRDADGNIVEGTFYRGTDGKLYKVNADTFEKFKSDPILGQKVNNYIPRVSPTDAKSLLQEAVDLPDDRISRESKITGLQNQAAAAQAESDRLNNLGFFGQLKEGFSIMNERAKTAQTQRQAEFFAAKNRQSPPEAAPVGTEAPNIIESGKKFFQKVGSFFSGK